MEIASSRQEDLSVGGKSAAAARSRFLGRSARILAFHSLLYGATLVGACADLPLGLNVVFAAANGICIALLFIIGHDCTHGSYLSRRSWNEWTARFAFIPCVHSVSLWRLTHDEHHRRTNLKGVDRVWAPMSAGEYAAATPFRRFVERIYRGPWGPIFYYCAEFWLPRLILPVAPESRKDWRRHLPDSLFAIAGFALTIAAICLLGRSLAPERPFWITLAIAWALPFTLWNYVLGLSFYLNHTHPDIPWFSDPNIWKRHEINVSGTVHVKFPREVPLLYAQAMVHTAHHVDRSVPVYGLPESQAALARRFGRNAMEYAFSLREYRRIVSICKLFDFERMCWTDFSGKPTAWTTAAAHRDHRAPAAQLA